MNLLNLWLTGVFVGVALAFGAEDLYPYSTQVPPKPAQQSLSPYLGVQTLNVNGHDVQVQNLVRPDGTKCVIGMSGTGSVSITCNFNSITK